MNLVGGTPGAQGGGPFTNSILFTPPPHLFCNNWSLLKPCLRIGSLETKPESKHVVHKRKGLNGSRGGQVATRKECGLGWRLVKQGAAKRRAPRRDL